MNKVILMGRLTADPDVRYTQSEDSTCVARYRLAVDRKYKKDGGADFISCVAFGRGGEFAERYLRKGMKMLVTGHIQTGSYEKQDGTRVYTTDVIVEDQEFCETKAANEAQRGDAPSPAGSTPTAGGFMDIPAGIDEELPFK